MLNDKTLASAGWAGIVFVVAVLSGAFIAGFGPDTDASAGEIREWLADSRTALLWGVVIGVLGTIPGVWFFIVLAQTIRRAVGDWVPALAVIIGALMVGVMAWAANAAVGALLWREGFVDTASDELVQYGWNAAFMFYATSSVGFALFLGAAAWGILRSGMAPSWLGWAAAGLGAISLLGVFAAIGYGAGPLVYLGFMGWSLWIVLAGIMMITGKVTLTAAAVDVRAAAPDATIRAGTSV